MTTTTVTLRETLPIRLVVTNGDASSTDAAPQRTEYELRACSSLTCHCCDLTLTPVRVASTSDDASTVPQTTTDLLFDVFERTVLPAAQNPSADDAHAAAAIEAALSAEVVHRLRVHLFAAKALAFEAFDGTTDTAEFPFEEVERYGTFVPIRDVIPFSPTLQSPADVGREFLVDEQYCVDPACECSRAVVGILEVQPIVPGEQRKPAQPIVDFLVDWQRDQWCVADRKGPLSLAESSWRDNLLAKNPDLFATLAKRHSIMRTLYATSAARAGRPTVRPATARRTARVGRNEPCPCGSGKKAKRCCQAPDGPAPGKPNT